MADEVLDTLLDQEGLEVDPVDRLEQDIPLHKAVRFVNGLDKNEWEAGAAVVELLLDAGADPRSVAFFPSCFLTPSPVSRWAGNLEDVLFELQTSIWVRVLYFSWETR